MVVRWLGKKKTKISLAGKTMSSQKKFEEKTRPRRKK
jgi:hypothetical protein